MPKMACAKAGSTPIMGECKNVIHTQLNINDRRNTLHNCKCINGHHTQVNNFSFSGEHKHPTKVHAQSRQVGHSCHPPYKRKCQKGHNTQSLLSICGVYPNKTMVHTQNGWVLKVIHANPDLVITQCASWGRVACALTLSGRVQIC